MAKLSKDQKELVEATFKQARKDIKAMEGKEAEQWDKAADTTGFIICDKPGEVPPSILFIRGEITIEEFKEMEKGK